MGFAADFMWDTTTKPQADTLNDLLEKFEDSWNTQIVHNFNDLMKSNLEAFTKTWNTEVVSRLNTAMSTARKIRRSTS